MALFRAMKTKLQVDILPQPDDNTCGPTCLHAVYRYYGDSIGLDEVIPEIERLDNGGTLAVYLASHALRRGYRATIYTYNLQMFDPTWFSRPGVDLISKLIAQAEAKNKPKLVRATRAYLDFLNLGGQLEYCDLSPELIWGHIERGSPILTGLSATYMYGTSREYGPNDDDDDVRGNPAGHFVVLCGADREKRTLLVADPLEENPFYKSQIYQASIDRVVGAILLGILTYDANLLIIEPGPEAPASPRANGEHPAGPAPEPRGVD